MPGQCSGDIPTVHLVNHDILLREWIERIDQFLAVIAGSVRLLRPHIRCGLQCDQTFQSEAIRRRCESSVLSEGMFEPKPL